MGIDATVLGSRTSLASTSVANFAQLVRLTLEPRIFVGLTFSYSDIPAWKRLINRPLATDERISLITTIFSDRNETEAVSHLSEDDAQSFVDMIDEVFHRSYTEWDETADLNRSAK